MRSFQAASGPASPQVLPPGASLGQVIEAVNSNSARVQSYYTPNARVTAAGLPTLRADIAMQPTRRFRLRADTPLTGAEVDLGSNEEEFWFWVRRAEPPALYYSRHDQFVGSAAQQILPIDPQWLVDAMGLVRFDPAAQHVGPTPIRGDRLEIRSHLLDSGDDRVKVTVVDATRAWVLEQHIYTAEGQRVGSALASQFRYDPVLGISLPSRIHVQMPQAQLDLTIDAGDFQLNGLSTEAQQLWTRPQYSGYPEINLAHFAPPPGSPPATSARHSATSDSPPPGNPPHRWKQPLTRVPRGY